MRERWAGLAIVVLMLAAVAAPRAAISCLDDAECDNGLFCDGTEQCVASVCQPGTPPVVSDGVECTYDYCDEVADVVVNANGPHGVPGLALPPIQIGQWSAVIDWPLQATHAALLPTGKVLWWRSGQGTGVYLWDPVTDMLENLPAPEPTRSLLCSGHVQMWDGGVLNAGGIANFIGQPEPAGAAVFDPWSETWTVANDLVTGRFYPSTTVLSDGRVLVTGGWSDRFAMIDVEIPEVYDPRLGTFTPISTAQLALSRFPEAFVLPDGSVFTSGPEADPAILDPSTWTWQPAPISGVNAGERSSAAEYRPGRILRIGEGDGLAEWIDMTDPSPVWRDAGAMKYPRKRADLVLLPDGTVLMMGGGLGGDAVPECAVHDLELWDPSTETWTPLASMTRPHLHHKSALLLPDGRVLLAGGENGTVPGGEKNAEVYSPPYLFKGPQPTLSVLPPGRVFYGDTFQVESPEAASIASVVFMRPGSVTHNFDQSQSYRPLSFARTGDTLDIVAPATVHDAPPGYYMLFLVDSFGVPSIAEFVQLAIDTDGDGYLDQEDNCRDVANGAAEAGVPGVGDQTDTDLDGAGNACDVDDDGDGLDDVVETNDGNYVSPTATGTNPLLADSDGDGLDDGAEVNTYGTSPVESDTDGDGISDGQEILGGTDPLDRNDPNPVPSLSRGLLWLLVAAFVAHGLRSGGRRRVGSP